MRLCSELLAALNRTQPLRDTGCGAGNTAVPPTACDTLLRDKPPIDEYEKPGSVVESVSYSTANIRSCFAASRRPSLPSATGAASRQSYVTVGPNMPVYVCV